VTRTRKIKKVTYKRITKLVRVTVGDWAKATAIKYPVTPLYGPPVIGDVVPATNIFCHRRVGVFRACVYAIGPASGSPLKIGTASNPVSRREDLQRGNWEVLVIHRSIYGGFRPEALRLERRLIERFDANRIPGVRGDWFSIDLAAFDAAIREAVCGQG